jgi:cytochrome P450
MARQIPLPPGPTNGVLGSLRAVQSDTLGFLTETAQKHGGLFRFRAGVVPVYVVAAPEAIHRVLVDNAGNYSKNTFTYRGTVSVIGHSVFNSDGEVWLRKRRIMQPVFQSSRFHMLEGIVAAACERTAERWSSGTVDAGADMVQLALEIAADAFFGLDVRPESRRIGEAVNTLADAFTRRYTSAAAALWGMVNLPLTSGRNVREARSVLYATIDAIMARGIQSQGESLTASLLQAADPEGGSALSPDELKAELLTLLIAGHETTAYALAWCWYLLAHHNVIQKQVRKEAVSVLGSRPATLEDLPQLPYLRQVLDETLRLYPSAWGFTRRAEQEDVVMGRRVPKGARLVISPYVAHRLPDVWERPDEFIPDRFTPAVAQARSPYAYIPFGAGPRQCIGKRFALIEAQLVLANLVRRFAVTPADSAPVPPTAQATLRPTRPIRLHVSAVAQSAHAG